MKKSNLYVCFSKKMAIELKAMGCKLEKIDINAKYPKYFVYYFLWDEKLDECLNKLKIKEKNKNE